MSLESWTETWHLRGDDQQVGPCGKPRYSEEFVKKRASKPRAPKSTVVADECAEYRESISEYVCEVEMLFRKDAEAVAWINTAKEASRMNARMQIHHIFGRSRNPESNWFCNLIQVSKACHDAGHDRNPATLEICSLMSKLNRHRRDQDLQIVGLLPLKIEESRLHWHPLAMAKICGCISLAGRIEGILLPKLSGHYVKMCHELLEELAK